MKKFLYRLCNIDYILVYKTYLAFEAMLEEVKFRFCFFVCIDIN